MHGLELALAKYDLTAQISKHIAELTNLTAKYVWTGTCIMHQSIPSTNIPPGDPRGFALYCCPGAGIYT